MKTTIDIEVLGFTGFYQGIWDQGENEWREIHEMKYGEHEDFESLHMIEDWGFPENYREEVGKLFATEYVDQINALLGLDIKLIKSCVSSPREYNFSTDEIYATIEIGDYDAADGEEIALTTDTPCGSEKFFHSDFFEAITDWDGEGNTKDYGNFLNPKIALDEGQYIPSLAQLYLILLNINEVNQALEAVGGTPMKKNWYWSSAENSAYYSWYVSFGSGGSGSHGKYSAYVVRPAVALSV